MNPTLEQLSILTSTGKSFRIMAGAGSGKTTTLTLYIRETINEGLAKANEIVFITFTRLASQDITRKIRKLLPGARLCTGTFHKVMLHNFMKAAGLTPPHPVKLYDGCMEKNVEFMLDQMRTCTEKIVKHLLTFKLLVVDEFQDLDPQQFEFITLFRKINPRLQIIAIGDLAQNIYRFRGTSNEFLRRLLKEEVVPELDTFYLRTNFRSSKAILDAVNAVFADEIRDGHVQPMICGSEKTGPRPAYFEASASMYGGEYETAVVDTIAPLILKAKRDKKSLALIFPIIKCQSYETILALLSSRLTEVDFHRIAKEDATSAIVEITYDAADVTAPIQLSTFHASKGLEWDTVVLVNVSDDVYKLGDNDVDDEGFYTERTNLLYVGMTRAREGLYIFGQGVRHRILARADLSAVMDVTQWGESRSSSSSSGKRLSSVANLVKRAKTEPDLFDRMVACSECIMSTFHRGEPMYGDAIYDEMKKRNRELEFGTFVDWQIKMVLSDKPTLQCRLLEVLNYMNKGHWIHKDNVKASSDVLEAVISDFFERAGNSPSADLALYDIPVRIAAGFQAKKFNMTPELRCLYMAAEDRILTTYNKGVTLRDAYILSHTFNLYAHGQLNAIRAVDAPVNSYMGLPDGFDEFAAASLAPATRIIKAAVGATEFEADISVITESLIYGETDLITKDRSCIVEIKCSAETSSSGLRGSTSCTNLLQLLAYVAMGRHGVSRLEPRWALLVNPLTATWERYDLSTWSYEQSQEFLNCLEELRERA